MQIKRSDKTATQVELTVIADEATLASLKKHVLSHFRGKVKVAGFRAGKEPLDIIEKNLNPENLQSEFLEEAINNLYSKAVEAEKLKTTAQPQIQVTKFVPFTTLEFTAEIEVVGDMKLGNYKQIKKAKPTVSITVKDVNDIVAALQKRLAEKKEVKRGAKNGDEVLIDFKGVDAKGVAVNGAEGKEYPLLLGSNAFIPGFETNLLGVKAGQEKSFVITFPKDYGVAALQSKKVTFTVKVNKVQELKEPKQDDMFASQAGPFKTLSELKADIKKQLSVERQNEADRKFENELLHAIADKSSVVIPDSLINSQIERAEQEERKNLAYKGQTWQEHLAEEGVSEEEHRVRNKSEAEKNVKVGLVLAEIAEMEDIQITPEELEIRLQVLKGQYQDPAMQAELEKDEARRDIASRLMTEKTIAKVVDYATK